jgi:hypothetical protein
MDVLDKEAERGGGVRTDFAESGGCGSDAVVGVVGACPFTSWGVTFTGLFGTGGGGGGSNGMSWSEVVLSEGCGCSSMFGPSSPMGNGGGDGRGCSLAR